jgi:hypothetical protein
MTNKADKQAEEIAQLKREVEALKAKVDPPKSTFKEMSDAEWRDHVHQMRERQANSWMPPNAIREMASHPCNQVMPGVIQDRHAPNSPATIPRTEGPSNARSGNVAGSGTGWAAEIPLSNPPGVAQADRLMDAQDARDRAELARKLKG